MEAIDKGGSINSKTGEERVSVVMQTLRIDENHAVGFGKHDDMFVISFENLFNEFKTAGDLVNYKCEMNKGGKWQAKMGLVMNKETLDALVYLIQESKKKEIAYKSMDVVVNTNEIK